jgi:hypothetical protein
MLQWRKAEPQVLMTEMQMKKIPTAVMRATTMMAEHEINVHVRRAVYCKKEGNKRTQVYETKEARK